MMKKLFGKKTQWNHICSGFSFEKSTYSSLWQNGLLSAEGTRNSEALRWEVGTEATKAKGVKARKNLKYDKNNVSKARERFICKKGFKASYSKKFRRPLKYLNSSLMQALLS